MGDGEWVWAWFDSSPMTGVYTGETYGVRRADEVLCYTNRFKAGYEDAVRIAAAMNSYERGDLPATGVTAEDLAKSFHGIYEHLAPLFGYATRRESAVAWEDVPESNRRLMTETCQLILQKWFPGYVTNWLDRDDPAGDKQLWAAIEAGRPDEL